MTRACSCSASMQLPGMEVADLRTPNRASASTVQKTSRLNNVSAAPFSYFLLIHCHTVSTQTLHFLSCDIRVHRCTAFRNHFASLAATA